MCDTEEVRVCGQCSEPIENEEYYGCPVNKCDLVLCPTCSNPEVHLRSDGNCPDWWGKSLSKVEIAKRMKEVAQSNYRYQGE